MGTALRRSVWLSVVLGGLTVTIAAQAPRLELRAGDRIVLVGNTLAEPVTLATIKQLAIFADSPLVRQGRLSVVSLTAPQWKALTGGN